MALDREQATFRRVLPDLLADPTQRDRFALLHADELVGVYLSFEAAADAGYDKFGREPFLVKPITPHEAPQFFPRGLDRCLS